MKQQLENAKWIEVIGDLVELVSDPHYRRFHTWKMTRSINTNACVYVVNDVNYSKRQL